MNEKIVMFNLLGVLLFLSLLIYFFSCVSNELVKADNALEFCKSSGYDGIIDKGTPVVTRWVCYKDVNGFIEYSPELSAFVD